MDTNDIYCVCDYSSIGVLIVFYLKKSQFSVLESKIDEILENDVVLKMISIMDGTTKRLMKDIYTIAQKQEIRETVTIHIQEDKKMLAIFGRAQLVEELYKDITDLIERNCLATFKIEMDATQVMTSHYEFRTKCYISIFHFSRPIFSMLVCNH